MKKHHYYWLDLVRFLAAFTVLVVHARAFSFVEYGALTEKNVIIASWYAITRLGNEAVLVFFVLSGFFVGGRVIEKTLNGSFSLISYIIDRSVRIILPLIPALCLSAIIKLIVDGSFNWFVLIGNIFSLQGIICDVFGGNGPLWSLAYEVWFYVLAFAIAGFALKKQKHMAYIILVVLVLLVFTKLNPVYLFCWLIGSLLYVKKPDRFSVNIFVISFLLLLYSIAGTQFGSESISITSSNYQMFLFGLNASRITLSLSFALLIQQIILIEPKGIFFKRIDRFGTSLASFSYTLYLTHYPVLNLLSHFGFGRSQVINLYSVSVCIFKIVFCLAISVILYALFEKHTNAIKKRLNYAVDNYSFSLSTLIPVIKISITKRFTRTR